MLEFAKTPPKGWNSWDVYGASVTEEEVKRNADIMAEKLKVYGWDYVVVDIQWYEPGAESAAYRKFADLKMDEYSRVLPAENRFPSSADGAGFAHSYFERNTKTGCSRKNAYQRYGQNSRSDCC